jgi:hypothetical protein
MKVLKHTPEAILIGITLLYWYFTANVFNPVAIVLLLVLGVQIVSKNKLMGVLIGSLFSLLSMYMVLALISELNEFDTFNYDARVLLFTGGAGLGISLLASVGMVIKNIELKSPVQA